MALSIFIDFGYTPHRSPPPTKPVEMPITGNSSSDCLDEASAQAEQEIIDHLMLCRGALVPMWRVINDLCDKPWLTRDEVRAKRMFYLRQLTRLRQEKKVKRYRRGLDRGKVRIHEGFALYGRTQPA